MAGILVELTGKTGDAANLVIGAGINLQMREPAPDTINQGWINLQEAGIEINRNTLASTFISELRSALAVFELQGLEPFIPRWEKLDNYFNRPIRLIIGNREIHGIDRGIDRQGALLLEADGLITPYIWWRNFSARRIKKGGIPPLHVHSFSLS